MTNPISYFDTKLQETNTEGKRSEIHVFTGFWNLKKQLPTTHKIQIININEPALFLGN